MPGSDERLIEAIRQMVSLSVVDNVLHEDAIAGE